MSHAAQKLPSTEAPLYTEIKACRMCQSPDLQVVCDLGMMALTGVFPKQDAENVPQGPMTLCKCNHCHLVQLKHDYDMGKLYGETYGYRSGLNQSMVRHLAGKVEALQKLQPLAAGDWIIDIGANDGTTLGSYTVEGLNRLGIDPSAGKFRQYYKPGIQLVEDFFTADNARKIMGTNKAKIVTSIAMFYDLPAPLQFAQDIFDVLADDGVWHFEQSYLPLMLQTRSYDTICQEHLEYYALHQITYLCDRIGFKIVDLQFNDVNGGSFAVTVTKKTNTKLPESTAVVEQTLQQERDLGLHTDKPWATFRAVAAEQREELVTLLKKIKAEGKKVIGYGASTKGNVTLQYCDITTDLLPYVAEVNPDKFGAFTPGTAIPIISEAEARAMNPDYFLVLPWHFKANIIAREQAFLNNGGKLVFPMPELDIVEKG